MSVRVGYAYTCDRRDCDESISLVPRGVSVADLLAQAGWSWSSTGTLRHFCPVHSQKQNTPPSEGGVLRGIPNSEGTLIGRQKGTKTRHVRARV